MIQITHQITTQNMQINKINNVLSGGSSKGKSKEQSHNKGNV